MTGSIDDLIWIMGLSAGIGRSFSEAEANLKKSKEFKIKLPKDDSIDVKKVARDLISGINGPYRIITYNPEIVSDSSLFYDANLEKDVNTQLELYKKYEAKKEILPEVFQDINDIIMKSCYDQSTGVYTPFGHLFDKKLNGLDNNGIYILMDGDDMGFWNFKREYSDVTEHIEAVGKSLLQSLRHYDRRSNQSAPKDYVTRGFVNRTHGSAGDEFLIELFCDPGTETKITERIIRNAYLSQLDIYGIEFKNAYIKRLSE